MSSLFELAVVFCCCCCSLVAWPVRSEFSKWNHCHHQRHNQHRFTLGLLPHNFLPARTHTSLTHFRLSNCAIFSTQFRFFFSSSEICLGVKCDAAATICSSWNGPLAVSEPFSSADPCHCASTSISWRLLCTLCFIMSALTCEQVTGNKLRAELVRVCPGPSCLKVLLERGFKG